MAVGPPAAIVRDGWRGQMGSNLWRFALSEGAMTHPASSPPSLHLTLQDDADALLGADPLALVIGMLLDQQMPMERAFRGPHVLATRLGVQRLSASELASAELAQLEQLCSTPPAVHRFPKAMAGRIQALAAHVVERWDGEVSRMWTTADTGAEVRERLEALPGFGPAKAAIFTALLGKQLGVTPPGWQQASAPYGEPGGFRSVADVVDRASLEKVRQTKSAAREAAKAADGRSA